ncbi:hypothetical protein SPRG_06205 [Saprolegnia parasitica CBS 223.65]|uniref:Uncharacterized protein n=1 Tax=Saprolegnia parasitica (strain CBS 223.65) TaxID=695850 RepID=A0A067CCE6_SAPPC|nr:hypothetical protein SPRG_06205 [Saprolegnia parasitica CBS 223.65]KDO28158.1 hypothetical protein SPRG_06205 [Saprolegnia parasitica CBS 223.65]|eukprot:XP_012200985.1 hypothetical protein SPRG_06205 [Saprolegnia parasitica CBS 223.65]
MSPKSQPGRRKHGRDGLDVIQNHVRISIERVHRARLQGPTTRQPKAHVEEPTQVAALGQYLEAKMKVSEASQEETVAASPRRHRCGSDSAFGLEFKLSRILKQSKRRSGMRVAKPNLDQRSKLTAIKSRNGAAAQTVVARQREREHNDNPLGLSENVLFAFRAVAHVWLARKRRKDRAMRENVTNKLVLHQSRPKELSPAVFDIISKSFVTPVPALQFFDTGTEMPPIQRHNDVIPTRSALAPSPPSAAPMRPVKPATAPASLTPRGICYTIDSSGHRQSKMQHSAELGAPRRARPLYASKLAASMDDAVVHTLNKRLR